MSKINCSPVSNLPNKKTQGMLGDAFSEEMTYNTGEYCIYQNALYKFTSDKEPGAWDETKVEATTVDAEMSDMQTQINELTSGNTTTVPSDYAYRGHVSFRKYGAVKSIYINGFKNVPVNESITICSIPEGFESIFDIYTYDMVNLNGIPFRFSVNQQTLAIRIYSDTFKDSANTIVCVSYI